VDVVFLEWKMKMLNQLKAVAVLAMLVLIPTSSMAQAGDIDLKGILNPATAAFGAKPGDDAVAQVLNAGLRDAEKTFTTNKEEQKMRDEVGALRDRNDRQKQNGALITAFQNSISDATKATNQAMESLYAKLGNSAGPGVSAADTDTSAVSGVCSEGVDLAQFASLDSQMRSEPVNFLRKEGGKAIAEAKKEEKKATLAKYMTLVKALKDKNRKGDAEAEPQVEDSLAYLDTAKPEGLEDAHRIDRLMADKEKLSAELTTGNDKQIDLLSKLVPMILDPESDEKTAEMSAITGPFVQNLQAYRKSLQESATNALNKAHKNCEDEAVKVGRDQPLGPASMLNKAYQSVLAFYGNDPNSYASTFFNAISSEARVMQCTKTAAKVEEKLGANMQAQIAQLEGVQDRKAFLEGALATMTALGKASSEVGKTLKKPLKQCDKLAKFEQKLEQFAGNVQQHMQQQQQQKPQGSAQGLATTRSAPASAPSTHTGLQQRQG
jgi:hypothetical protein